MTTILFIHPNFPAQFRHLAERLGEEGYRVFFLTANPRPEWVIKGVTKIIYTPKDSANTKSLFQSVHAAETQAEAVLRACLQLAKQGITPDVIYGASGWGGTWFIKDIFPSARFIGYFEWFYNPLSADILFGRTSEPPTINKVTLRLRNTVILNDLLACDVCITPSKWQLQQFPALFRDRFTVVHDGINTHFFSPQPDQSLQIANLPLSGRETIITYATRGMEPYRGFPQFIEALPAILHECPGCHVVIAGDDRVCYGTPREDGKSWKEYMLEQVKLPKDRVHFTGPLPYGEYRQLLCASTVHVYLTRPFVLSWSLLEAMSCGCLVVASDTEPVQEIISDGVNGLLCDFVSPDSIAKTVIKAVLQQQQLGHLRRAARKTIEHGYALSTILPRLVKILVPHTNLCMRGGAGKLPMQW